jgi:hypothetical protein
MSVVKGELARLLAKCAKALAAPHLGLAVAVVALLRRRQDSWVFPTAREVRRTVDEQRSTKVS